MEEQDEIGEAAYAWRSGREEIGLRARCVIKFRIVDHAGWMTGRKPKRSKHNKQPNKLVFGLILKMLNFYVQHLSLSIVVFGLFYCSGCW